MWGHWCDEKIVKKFGNMGDRDWCDDKIVKKFGNMGDKDEQRLRVKMLWKSAWAKTLR